jgi:hypothetical protein
VEGIEEKGGGREVLNLASDGESQQAWEVQLMSLVYEHEGCQSAVSVPSVGLVPRLTPQTTLIRLHTRTNLKTRAALKGWKGKASSRVRKMTHLLFPDFPLIFLCYIF